MFKKPDGLGKANSSYHYRQPGDLACMCVIKRNGSLKPVALHLHVTAGLSGMLLGMMEIKAKEAKKRANSGYSLTNWYP